MEKFGVAAIITNDEDAILLAERGPAARDEIGLWESVGGGVNDGEQPDTAVIREVQEELGVTIEITQELLDYSSIPDEQGTVWHTKVYACRIISGEPVIQEPQKCTDIRWLAKSALDSVPLTSYTSEDFRRLGWLA